MKLFIKTGKTGEIMKKLFKKKGLSLIELMTTIVIMGILTTAAIPLGEVIFIRDKEIELREALSDTRRAIDNFKADNGYYPNGFPALAFFDKEKGDQKFQAENPFGKPYLRKSPPINPFASSNQAWILILTNCPGGGLEHMTLEEFNTTSSIALGDRQIYDIQFPSSDTAYFRNQISIYTSLDGSAYSSW